MSYKKQIVVLLAIAIAIFLPSVKETSAQVVFCPSGYTCTPIDNNTVPTCPVGYICTPVIPPVSIIKHSDVATTTSASISDARATVTRSNMELIYDNDRKEASLKATYIVSVSGGTQGMVIYKDEAAGGFANPNGEVVNAGPISSTLVAEDASLRTTTDQYGREMYSVFANQTARFIATVSANPKQMFAGNYRGVLQILLANTSPRAGGLEFKLDVLPRVYTNSKNIIGEVSPYITTLTSPVQVGEQMIIRGQRLTSNVFVDGAVLNVSMKGDANNISFALPSNITDGYHTLFIRNNETGDSNTFSFQVGKGSVVVTPPQPNANGETVTFSEKFYLSGTTIPTLEIAADNQYVVYLNGQHVASSQGDWNFTSVHSHRLFPQIIQGYNTLEIKVFNNYATGAYQTGLGNPAGLIYRVVQGDNILVASDGNEVVNNSGTSVVLSKQDPSWTSISGARWVWSRDYYGGTVNPPVSTISISNTSAQLGSPVVSNNTVTAYPATFKFTLTAGNSSIYVSNTLSLIQTTSNSTLGVNHTGIAYTPSSLAGDSSSYLVIPAGSSRSFTISTMITNAGLNGVGRVQLNTIMYGLNPSSLYTNYITSGLENLVVSPVFSTPTPPPSQTPTIIFRVSPTTVAVNQSATITWSTQNANSCVGSGFRTNNATNGSQVVKFTTPTTANYSITCIGDGGSKTEYATLVVVQQSVPVIEPDPDPVPVPTPPPVEVNQAPTANFTINGQESYTYNVGETNNYEWSSTNADVFSSSYTSTGGNVCGGGPWVANTANGSSRSYISSAYAGCVWTVTYTAKNSQTGQSASDTVVVTVNPVTPAPAPTTTTNTTSSVWDAIKSIFSR